MSTFTVETRITHKYLMNKTKSEVADMYMQLLDDFDKLQKSTLQGQLEQRFPNACGQCNCQIPSPAGNASATCMKCGGGISSDLYK